MVSQQEYSQQEQNETRSAQFPRSIAVLVHKRTATASGKLSYL